MRSLVLASVAWFLASCTPPPPVDRAMPVRAHESASVEATSPPPPLPAESCTLAWPPLADATLDALRERAARHYFEGQLALARELTAEVLRREPTDVITDLLHQAASNGADEAARVRATELLTLPRTTVLSGAPPSVTSTPARFTLRLAPGAVATVEPTGPPIDVSDWAGGRDRAALAQDIPQLVGRGALTFAIARDTHRILAIEPGRVVYETPERTTIYDLSFLVQRGADVRSVELVGETFIVELYRTPKRPDGPTGVLVAFDEKDGRIRWESEPHIANGRFLVRGSHAVSLGGRYGERSTVIVTSLDDGRVVARLPLSFEARGIVSEGTTIAIDDGRRRHQLLGAPEGDSPKGSPLVRRLARTDAPPFSLDEGQPARCASMRAILRAAEGAPAPFARAVDEVETKGGPSALVGVLRRKHRLMMSDVGIDLTKARVVRAKPQPETAPPKRPSPTLRLVPTKLGAAEDLEDSRIGRQLALLDFGRPTELAPWPTTFAMRPLSDALETKRSETTEPSVIVRYGADWAVLSKGGAFTAFDLSAFHPARAALTGETTRGSIGGFVESGGVLFVSHRVPTGRSAFVTAHRVSTGETIWQSVHDAGDSSILATKGALICAHNPEAGAGGVTVLDASTGRVLQRAPVSGGASSLYLNGDELIADERRRGRVFNVR